MKSSSTGSNCRCLRILAIVLGFLLLFWLPIEDQSLTWIILFSAAICALAAARLLVSFTTTASLRWFVYPLSGVLAGLAITPVSLALMAFKSGIHGHGFPDFTADQVTAVIVGTPLWAASGLLVGLGVGLWQKTSDRETR